jgi:hypothetical protein
LKRLALVAKQDTGNPARHWESAEALWNLQIHDGTFNRIVQNNLDWESTLIPLAGIREMWAAGAEGDVLS